MWLAYYVVDFSKKGVTLNIVLKLGMVKNTLHTVSKIKSIWKKENLTDLNELKECYKYSIEQFDRLQVYISAIALGWLITILGNKNITDFYLFVLFMFAIIAFGVAIISSFINHYLSADTYYKKFVDIVNNEKKKDIFNRNIKYIDRLNLTILISVITGIISTIVICFLRIY